MKWLDIEAGLFTRKFPGNSFTIRHKLIESPLFQLPRLVELSRCLPASCVEYNLGELTVSQNPDLTPINNLSIEETIQQIESCHSWMVLKYVEQDPAYEELLDTCLEEVNAFSESSVGAMDKKEAFIFISSPGSVTPFHFDPEHNFLLQIRGTKTLHTFDRLDRELVPEASIEQFYNAGNTHRNLKFQDNYQDKAASFYLQPGDGLFIPQNAPHWVKNGDKVSISFSITYRSAYSERLARLYYVNSRLRKCGFTPSPVMRSPLRDSIKDNGYRLMRKLKSISGYK